MNWKLVDLSQELEVLELQMLEVNFKCSNQTSSFLIPVCTYWLLEKGSNDFNDNYVGGHENCPPFAHEQLKIIFYIFL